jgi:aminopeptidase N
MKIRLLLLLVLSAHGFAAAPAAGVSRELAQQRAAAISNLRYTLALDIKERSPGYPGHVAITFDLKTKLDPVVLDFRDDSARRIQVNGKDADTSEGNGHILIPGRYFAIGTNRVEMDFEAKVAEANRAITRYLDAQDGSEYVYTLFVPMDASMEFPCFDQPDLKGRFTFSATAPAGWTVISNGVATSPGEREFRFAETKPISTYLFAFAAGPFEALRYEAGSSGAAMGTPLRLWVRKSMAARAKEEWPEVARFTREGIEKMSAFFAQPFPFPKYDQVLIPGLAYGGMEHAGSTFLREDVVIFRTAPTVSDHHRRSVTVLHELAHQWFGDLVTMRWFDDLWLKEGFAQYMAFHTLAELEPPNEVWTRFYESIKPVAYAIDSTRGTTPIYQQVRNLADAKSAYGPIVYQKAPSLLRVLNYKIGETGFRDGVRIYLKDHAYANAEWKDLIGAFSKASGQNLTPWANAWIQQPGMPEVNVKWTCNSRNRITEFEISQSDTIGGGHTWPVETEILLGYKNDPGAKIPIEFELAKSEVHAAIGKSCPDYVFSNDEDHGYGRFMLDGRSQAGVAADIAAVKDPLLRALLWGALWDSVREAKMAASGYIELVLKSLPGETDLDLTQNLIGRMRASYVSYLTDKQRAAVGPRMEALLLERMKNSATVDQRITYFRAFVGAASQPESLAELRELLAGKDGVPGVPLKQRDRWTMIATLARQGDASAIDAESERDKSDDGRKSAYAARAGIGDAANKQRYFDDYLHSRTVPEDWVSGSLGDFNAWNQSALTLPYLKPALEALPQMKRERKIFFVNGWLASFVGSQKSAEALGIVNGFLANPALDPDLRLKVIEVRDELERTVRIRARFGD